ncbi:MAG: hypothetical protein U1F12_03300 [Pseudomonadales bacterium]|jgi:hypothetical protein
MNLVLILLILLLPIGLGIYFLINAYRIYFRKQYEVIHNYFDKKAPNNPESCMGSISATYTVSGLAFFMSLVIGFPNVETITTLCALTAISHQFIISRIIKKSNAIHPDSRDKSTIENEQKKLSEINKKLVKVQILDIPGPLLLGMVIYAKFGTNEPFHPLLKNELVLMAMFIVGGMISLWGILKATKLAKQKDRVLKGENI